MAGVGDESRAAHPSNRHIPPFLTAEIDQMSAMFRDMVDVVGVDLSDPKVRVAILLCALTVSECRDLVSVAVLVDAWTAASRGAAV